MSSTAPCGTPGSVRLSTTDVTAIVTNDDTLSVTPYNRARNETPTSQVIGVATLNVDTASGSTNPDTCTGSPRRRDPSTRAGRDASDELELSATACAGSTARVNAARWSRPRIAATGYISSVNRAST